MNKSTRRWIVLPASLALGVSSVAFAQQSRDNDATARERREAREARQEERQQDRQQQQRRDERREERRADDADAQAGIPARVQRAIEQRYPQAKVQAIGSNEQNGVQTYLVRINAKDGETTARATERGDFLYLGYPGVSYDRLPRPVTQVLEGMFQGKPETVQKYENTTYLVNADFGGRAYQVELNAVGRLVDAKPMSEVKRSDPTQYPRADRSAEQELQPRLNDYFQDPKVKAVHRFPESEGFYWVNLSTATEDDVWVLMDAKREVAEYRTRVSGNEVPQPVTRAVGELFKGADVNQVYRNNQIHYNVLQPAGDEAVLVAITPLGNITRIRQANAGDIRREFADREPDELFRSRQRGQDDDRQDRQDRARDRARELR